MLEEAVYKFYRFLSKPIAKLLAKTIVTPNQVTLLVFLLALVSAYFFSVGDYKNLIIASLVLQVSLVLDFTDGTLARLKSCATSWGAFIDSFSDRARTVIILFAISWGIVTTTQNSLWWIVGFVAISNILLLEIMGLLNKIYISSSDSDRDSSTREQVISRFGTWGKTLEKIHAFIFASYLGEMMNTCLITIFALINKLTIYLIFASIYGIICIIYYLFIIWLQHKWRTR